MKKRSLFICGLFLSTSPILSMDKSDNFIDRAIKFTSEKVLCWINKENEKKLEEKLEHIPASAKEKTIQQLKSEVWDTKINRELVVYPADLSCNKNKQPQNNKLKPHFIGDGYGWIIVYY